MGDDGHTNDAILEPRVREGFFQGQDAGEVEDEDKLSIGEKLHEADGEGVKMWRK